MELVRIIVQGPIDGQSWVVAVPNTSTAYDLSQLPLAGLAAKIGNNVPLQLTADGGPVYYRWGTASGVVSETAVSTTTGMANLCCGVKPNLQSPPQAESVPNNTTYLIVKVASGAATGLLRIQPVG